jgi:5'-nucleotidase
VTPRILLTNDDGIAAPGLAALRSALEGLGEITVIAPERDSSAIARAITVDRALRLRQATFGDGWRGLGCDGTPVDCVRVALAGAACPAPDLVVAGVNHGANLGADVTYSGTVGAALEAALRGRPGLAFSIDSRQPRWLAESAALLRDVTLAVLRRGLPAHTILNVNLPDLPACDMGDVRPARLGGASCRDRVVLDGDGHAAGGVRACHLPCDGPDVAPGAPIDIDVVAAGAAAITPLRFDLVHTGLLADLAGWGLARKARRA